MSKQAPQDVLGCLIQLRTELRQCPESEFEQRRDAMLALVNAALDEKLQHNRRRKETIEALQAIFIQEAITGDPPSLEAMKARYAKLRESIVGLDAGGLTHLFTALEWKAVTVIQSLKALAQTTDPGRIAEQCPWLPGRLIHNADRALKADKIKGGAAKGLTPEMIKAHREDCAKWVLDGGKSAESTGKFDLRMSEKYCRTSVRMAKYRKEAMKFLTASSERDESKHM